MVIEKFVNIATNVVILPNFTLLAGVLSTTIINIIVIAIVNLLLLMVLTSILCSYFPVIGNMLDSHKYYCKGCCDYE